MSLTRQALSYRFLGALKRRIANSSPAFPSGNADLILLTDGIWFRFKGRQWVAYLLALKRPSDDYVAFIDPVIQCGPESKGRWINAIQTIPAEVQSRIRAVVCDNYAGSMTIARTNGWILQYCQFHLLASLHSKLGLKHPRNVAAKPLRREGYELVKTALETDDCEILAATISRIRVICDDPSLAWRYGNILREFARRISAYRAYKDHPALRLPKTTSSLESMCSILRDMIRRARSLRNQETVILWLTVYIRLRPRVVCKPA